MKTATPFAMLSLLTSANAFAPAARGLTSRIPFAMASTVAGDVATEVSGEEGTESYRLNFKSNGAAMSPWHDLPLGGGEVQRGCYEQS